LNPNAPSTDHAHRPLDHIGCCLCNGKGKCQS